MYRTTSVLALGLFLGLAPVAVQAQTQDTQPAQEYTQEPAQTETQAPAQTEAPAQPETQQQAEEPVQPETQQQAEQPTEPGVAEQPATADTGYIAAQEEGTILNSSLMGATVYSPQDESIGKISDLIMTPDGDVQGVVLGVGGFLGIGEKKVGLGLGSLTITPEADGSVKLILNATREELENAPDFKTLAQIEAERQAEQVQQQQQTQQPVAPAPAD